jgi:hypothetical protein
VGVVASVGVGVAGRAVGGTELDPHAERPTTAIAAPMMVVSFMSAASLRIQREHVPQHDGRGGATQCKEANVPAARVLCHRVARNGEERTAGRENHRRSLSPLPPTAGLASLLTPSATLRGNASPAIRASCHLTLDVWRAESRKGRSCGKSTVFLCPKGDRRRFLRLPRV